MTVTKSQQLYLLHAARIWSVFSLAFITLFFVGEGIFSDAAMLQTGEWIGMIFFPIGLTAGLILAWWREGLGGGLAIGSFLAFYIWHFIRSSSLPRGPYFALLAAPGLLFLLYWYVTNSQQGRQAKMG